MSLDLGDHVSEIPIKTNLSEIDYQLLEVSLSICKKDRNQWSIDELIEALAGALIHRYLVNDGTIHPALCNLHLNRETLRGLLDQTIKSDKIHRSLKTLLAVQLLFFLADNYSFSSITKHREYLTGIVGHNINELPDRIASISREKLTFFGAKLQARSFVDWSKIQIMRLLSI